MSAKRRLSETQTRCLNVERLETRNLLAPLSAAPQIFVPAKDVYLDGAARVDAQELIVAPPGASQQSAARTSYLAFRHTGFNGIAVHSARLRL